jgi:hypothetical protein
VGIDRAVYKPSVGKKTSMECRVKISVTRETSFGQLFDSMLFPTLEAIFFQSNYDVENLVPISRMCTIDV